MRLYTKLLLIMISLLVVVTIVQFSMNQYSQKMLVNEIQDSTAVISQLLQKSVADLTSSTDDEVSNLSDYVAEARNKGVNEVNIIGTEGEIIDSSNPDKIGKMRDLKRLGKEKGLKAIPGAKEQKGIGGTLVKPYKLVVPVIIGDEQIGFVEIDLLLDNIREIQHQNYIRRLTATFAVFVLAILVTIYLAKRYTKPINTLAAGVKQVADGDLSVTIPCETGDELGELASSFNEMVKQLKERSDLESRLKDAEHLSQVGQLAAGIAHEVRNPLNYINLAIGQLKKEIETLCGDSRSDIVEMTSRISEEVKRANYMIVTFMNYGKPLKIKRVPIDCSEMFSKVASQLNDKSQESGTNIICEQETDIPPFMADIELLKTCISNLVTNSIQALYKGGEIRLSAEFAKEENSIIVKCCDNGPGIPEENRQKIFTPYFTTKDVGTGLGLAITERIIKEHGGKILVDDSALGGACFVISIPYIPA